MNSIYYTFPFILLAFLLSCSKPNSSPKSTLPNIILVMADDQGWGDMAYNGHPVLQTPHFDTLAVEGLRFDHFYAGDPVCSPTRGSVLTGRNPNRFGCYSWGRTLRPQEHTIAEKLKEAGYVTGHFGKWHLGSVRRGSPVNPGASGFDEWLSAPNFFDNDPILSREGIAEQQYGESSMVTMDAALEFIHKHEGGKKPYFAVIWFGSPHLPHEAAEQDRGLYEDQPEDLQDFYGEITGMDRAMGKLRESLKRMDSYENTLLWYCSDNGGLPEKGSTGGRGHKAQIYEGGLRVPAIIHWPDVISSPRSTQIPAFTSDIFPTIMEIVGLTPDPSRPLDGESLLPLVIGITEKRKTTMSFWNFPEGGIRTPSAEWMADLMEAQKVGNMVGDSTRLRLKDIEITRQYPTDTLPGHAALINWPWKIHRIYHTHDSISYELYHLGRDSQESQNLVTIEPNLVEVMKEELEDWQRSVVRSMNGEDY